MENIFRTNTQTIKESFINSFIGNSFTDDCYVKPSIPYSWKTFGPSPKVLKISVSDYEPRLTEIILTPAIKRLKNPITIIRGGIGTGKSTTLQHILKEIEAKLCHKCTINGSCGQTKLLYLNFDFSFVNVVESTTQVTKWSVILKELALLTGDIEIEDEVNEFWPWVLENLTPYSFLPFYKILERAKPYFKKDITFLKSLRDSFYKEISDEELCYYRLFYIKYFRSDLKNFCSLSIFDNLDHLEPKDQREMIEFATRIHEVLNSKIIMAMRPYTLTKMKFANNLIEVVDHFMPDPIEVIRKRIECCKCEVDDTNVLRQLMLKIFHTIENNKYYNRILISTSGIGVRYALRNFFNLLLSPLLQAETDGTTNITNWKSNEFYQAYFCHEEPDSIMDTSNFVNIFTITSMKSSPMISTLKLRLLHRLFFVEQNFMSLGLLCDEFLDFGYQKYNIIETINDLLNKHRPLIWSDSQDYYDQDDTLPRNDLIILSPMGEHYLKDIVRDPFYLKECVMHYKKSRILPFEEWVDSTKEFIYEFANDEETKSINYIRNTSSIIFLSIYDSSQNLLSFFWEDLTKSMEKLVKRTQITIDTSYHHYIWNQIEKEILQHN